ncbi:PREDICTED: histone-lysine N-methyltransferase setd3 isoform X1 [Polistes dominula]|uniref:protein-histidine N-methyltransferase n=2 Tax=Polistes dominula TaxID=743375 RepID=A0ABM1I9F1_POLDO|nr:PREDICTED: histone-lysine N-methyltransferase setd3 isoform X1 [Polistes dominula]
MNKKKSHSSSKQNHHRRQTSTVKMKKQLNDLCDRVFHMSCDPAYNTQLWDYCLYIAPNVMLISYYSACLLPMKTNQSKQSRGVGQFMEWLKENDVNVDGASIVGFTGYDLGLKAERDFIENELILEIPRKLIFSTQTAAPELESFQRDPLIQQMPQVALAIALLIEKYKENSKWKPYIDILPTRYNTVLYMNLTEMSKLKGTLTLETALRQVRNITRQYTYFYRVFQNGNDAVSNMLKDMFAYDDYIWAVSTVMTRQNLIPSEDGSSMIHALIPMWDMCNHEEGKITTGFNTTSDCCECYAMRNFKKGEQIFISYGSRTNSDFLVHSGFVCLENKKDGVRIPLGISASDPLRNERIELLDKLGLPVTGKFLLEAGTEPISDSLLAFLRVFNMRKADLTRWLKSDKVTDLKHVDCALDTIVEENVMKFLLDRLKLLLAKYPSTLEEDLEKLNTRLPKRQRLIVQLRVSEMKILLNALDYVKQWLKV